MGDVEPSNEVGKPGYDPILKRVVTLEESWEMSDSPDTLRCKTLFHDKAKAALQEAGITPLELYEANPDATFLEMAKRLNRGANANGLKSAIYTQARKAGRLREVAKEMLRREVLSDFPKGWEQGGKPIPAIRITWSSDLNYVFKDRWIGNAARPIDMSLTVTSPPPEGWKPDDRNFPYIDILFDKYWPEDLDSA